MAVASWKGAIQFGPLLQFAVKASAADRETKFSFNQHHGLAGEDGVICGGRIRQGVGVCETCGLEAPKEDIVRGYGGKAGVDEQYLESLEKEKSGVMEIDGLVPASQIEPRWYRRSYDVLPDKGAEKVYALFVRLLERSDRVAIGKVVMSGKEAIVVLRPRSGLVAMELLWWPDELKQVDATMLGEVEVSDREVEMGMKLVEFMAKEFDPGAYVNEYAEQVSAYLESFTEGYEAPVIEKREAPAALASLEDALSASLAAFEPKAADKPKKKGKAA